MKTFRRGGVHPDPSKITADVPIAPLAGASKVELPLLQCIGAPSVAVVKPGDAVVAGQMVAKAGGFVGAPVHSPVGGTVKKIEKTRNPQGLWQETIIIEADAETCEPEPLAVSEPGRYGLLSDENLKLNPAEIVRRISEAGIVGLGGATFPTHVKLSIPEGKKAEMIIINGAECEPYLTCDDQLMRTCAAEIIAGARLLMRAVGADRAIVGIEENKPEAIEAMRFAATAFPEIEIVELKKRYPQGGEKQLIEALTGREVPMGGLPVDVGCVVDNVATAYAVFDAVCRRRPLTQRVVTVTGPSLSNPGNFLVPFGTPIRRLIEAAGGLPGDTGKVIAGGPMMGRAVSNLDAPTTKGLGGILVLPESMSRRPRVQPCIRCAKCVEACPMGLEPYLLATLSRLGRYEDAAKHTIMGCIECGCCSYSCPSGRPILDFIKLGKLNLRKKK